MNAGDSCTQWAGGFGACNTAEPLPALSSLRQAEAAMNTSDVDVDLQLLGESAGGDSVPDVPFPHVPLP
jgi:hypothetical protein